MSKRKLSKQQKRLQSSRKDKIQLDDEGKLGLVITNFGKRVLVESEDNILYVCNIRQNLGKLVAGDKVLWQHDLELNKGVVINLLPRTQELSRPGFRGQKRMIAANVNQIIIIASVVPGIHPDMIDRYLVAAYQQECLPLILINKVDLLKSEQDMDLIKEYLSPYKLLGIPIISTSIYEDSWLVKINELLKNKNSVLVGVSGAGKSSLIKVLIPDIEIKVSELSERTGLGKHTTTNSVLYHLPTGGNLLDSPGIRQFTPYPCKLEELEQAYQDFYPFLGQCKYHNCTHTVEPNCAIRTACEQEDIAETRYHSFQRLLKEFSELD